MFRILSSKIRHLAQSFYPRSFFWINVSEFESENGVPYQASGDAILDPSMGIVEKVRIDEVISLQRGMEAPEILPEQLDEWLRRHYDDIQESAISNQNKAQEDDEWSAADSEMDRMMDEM